MLSKLLRKLKRFFYFGDDFGFALKEIMNKRISNAEKIDLILKASAKYFSQYMYEDVQLAVWENYYEEFIIDGKKNENIAEGYMRYETGNYMYCSVLRILDAIQELNPKNPNKICQMLLDFNKDKTYFDPAEFYTFRSDFRTEELEKAKAIVKEIEKYYKQHTTPKVQALPSKDCLQ